MFDITAFEQNTSPPNSVHLVEESDTELFECSEGMNIEEFSLGRALLPWVRCREHLAKSITYF